MTITFSALAAEISAAHDIDPAEVADVLFDTLMDTNGITVDQADDARAHFQKVRDYLDSLTGGVHHAASTAPWPHNGNLIRGTCTCGWQTGGLFSNPDAAMRSAQNHVRSQIVQPS